MKNNRKKIFVSLQNNDYEICKEINKVAKISENVGSIVTFNGIVRGQIEKEKLNYLFIEHYPEMTEKSIYDIACKAYKKWNLNCLIIIHRIGKLFPKENIVFVAVSSVHRENSFLACENVMDYLKSSVPLWKKEVFKEKQYWIEPNKKDLGKIEKW